MPLHCRGLWTVVDVYQDIAPYPTVTHEFGVVAETAPPLPVEVSTKDRLDEEAQREELWRMESRSKSLKARLSFAVTCTRQALSSGCDQPDSAPSITTTFPMTCCARTTSFSSVPRTPD